MDYFDMISDTLDSMSMDAKDKFMDYLEFADINPTLMSMAEGLYAGFDKDMVAEQAGLKNRAVMMKYVPELREYLIDYCNTKVYLDMEKSDAKGIIANSRTFKLINLAHQQIYLGRSNIREKLLNEARSRSVNRAAFFQVAYIDYIFLCNQGLCNNPKYFKDGINQLFNSTEFALQYIKLENDTTYSHELYFSKSINKETYQLKLEKILKNDFFKLKEVQSNFHFSQKIALVKYRLFELKGDHNAIIQISEEILSSCSKEIHPYYYCQWVYYKSIAYLAKKNFAKVVELIQNEFLFDKVSLTNQVITKIILCKAFMHLKNFDVAQQIIEEIPELLANEPVFTPYLQQFLCQIHFQLGDYSACNQLILTMPSSITKDKDGYNLSNQLLSILCHHQLGNNKLAILAMRNLKRYCNRTLASPERKELYRNILQILPLIIYGKSSLDQIVEEKNVEIKAIKEYYETVWDPNFYTDVLKFHELLSPDHKPSIEFVSHLEKQPAKPVVTNKT